MHGCSAQIKFDEIKEQTSYVPKDRAFEVSGALKCVDPSRRLLLSCCPTKHLVALSFQLHFQLICSPHLSS